MTELLLAHYWGMGQKAQNEKERQNRTENRQGNASAAVLFRIRSNRGDHGNRGHSLRADQGCCDLGACNYHIGEIPSSDTKESQSWDFAMRKKGLQRECSIFRRFCSLTFPLLRWE